MAKLVIAFDSYEAVDSYEGRQAISQARSIPGVTGVRVYRAGSSPRYTLELDAEDDKVEDVQKAIETYVAPYRGYLSNWSVRTLREMRL
ncbi:MAG: hypothetical protein HPY83_10640 [Anaerolineae bacterium]|nr:hypothetical protein [Anaerolineae bacterium]